VIATTITLVVLSHYLPVIAAKLISFPTGFCVQFREVALRAVSPGTPKMPWEIDTMIDTESIFVSV
jgi:hypothetical protein